jgi:hypothetical protein
LGAERGASIEGGAQEQAEAGTGKHGVDAVAVAVLEQSPSKKFRGLRARYE